MVASLEKPACATARPRYYLLDTIRGVCIIGVLFFHFILDLNAFGVSGLEWMSPTTNLPVRIIQVFGQIMFMTISGICSSFSRNNLRRGLLTLAAAAGISLVTYFIVPQAFIYMGILHFLGLCMVLSHFILLAVHAIGKRRPAREKHFRAAPLVAALGFLLLLALCFNIYDPNYGIGLFGAHIPMNSFPLYGSFVGYLLGFGGYAGRLTADYFPLLPWLFAFLAGMCLGYYFKRDQVPAFFKRDFLKPATFVGRYSIWFYLAHQPVYYGLLMLVQVIVG